MTRFWTNEETTKNLTEIEKQYKENKNKDFQEVSSRSEKLCEGIDTSRVSNQPRVLEPKTKSCMVCRFPITWTPSDYAGYGYSIEQYCCSDECVRSYVYRLNIKR